MKTICCRIVSILTLFSLAAWSAAAPPTVAALTETPAPAPVRVERWLLLGPADAPLPVFHDETDGGVKLEDLLKDSDFDQLPADPAEGRAVVRPGGSPLAWRSVAADAGGRVALPRPEPPTPRPAEAWLAAYLDASRWSEIEIVLTGTHPRRFWVDGAPLASGTKPSDGDAGKVSASAKLAPGRHLLLVKTLLDPAVGGAWTVGAEFGTGKAAAGAVRTGVDPLRPLGIDDILGWPSILDMAVSPDGARVALAMRQRPAGAEAAESWLEVRRIADGGLEGTWRGGIGFDQVDWAPVGRKLSYVSTEHGKDKSRSTLWLLDLETGAAAPVLRGIENLVDYHWLPDGSGVVFSVREEAEKGKTGIKRVEGLMDRWAHYRDKRALHLAGVPGGLTRRLTAGGLTCEFDDISPDGRRLLFTRTAEDVSRRPYSRTELWELDLADGAARKLRDFGWLRGARYAPDGRRLLVLAGPSAFGETGVNVPAGMIPNESDGELYIWDPAADAVTAFTRDFDPAVDGAVWSRADGRIYFRAADGTRVRLYAYDERQPGFTRIDLPVDVADRLVIAGRASAGAVTGTSPWQPQVLVGLDLAAGAARVLLQPAAAELARVRTGRVEDWRFQAETGKTIDGYVVYPPDFDPSRRYPVIVNYYGGTTPVSRAFGGRYPKEWWASLGYVVYVPQPSGATGYGQEFSARHVNDWGVTSAGEIIKGTRRFLEAHSFADPERVGCIGASYGGFMTMRLLTLTDRFAAAVSHAGISQIASYWGEGYWGYSYSALATANSFPWNRPDIYVEQSPLYHADKVKTPLLLTHGSADTNVPVGESDAFFVALKLLGTPVEYLQVEGLDHLILDHDKRRRWSESIMAWYDRWLKGQPEWWDALYPPTK
jgi:dipeptidyl aminopeptidase/acylaminoacyl peptidase